MAYEVKEGQGALFINDKKETGTNQPDLRGYLQLAGERVQLAGWKKKSKAGQTYTSLQIDTQPPAGGEAGAGDEESGDE